MTLSNFDESMKDIKSIDIDEFFEEINFAEMITLSPKLQHQINKEVDDQNNKNKNDNDDDKSNDGFTLFCDEEEFELNDEEVVEQHKLNMFRFSSVYNSDIEYDVECSDVDLESDEHLKFRSRAASINPAQFLEYTKKISIERFEKIML